MAGSDDSLNLKKSLRDCCPAVAAWDCAHAGRMSSVIVCTTCGRDLHYNTTTGLCHDCKTYCSRCNTLLTKASKGKCHACNPHPTCTVAECKSIAKGEGKCQKHGPNGKAARAARAARETAGTVSPVLVECDMEYEDMPFSYLQQKGAALYIRGALRLVYTTEEADFLDVAPAILIAARQLKLEKLEVYEDTYEIPWNTILTQRGRWNLLHQALAGMVEAKMGTERDGVVLDFDRGAAVLAFLLDVGVDALQLSERGETALGIAADWAVLGDAFEIMMKHVLSRRTTVQLNGDNRDKFCILFTLLQKGQYKSFVDLLANNEINPNWMLPNIGNEMVSLLQMSARCADHACVAALLRCGADSNAPYIDDDDCSQFITGVKASMSI